jgi:hypothetical protein
MAGYGSRNYQQRVSGDYSQLWHQRFVNGRPYPVRKMDEPPSVSGEVKTYYATPEEVKAMIKK